MTATSIARDRFGLGARAGERPPADPRAALRDAAALFDPRPAVIAAVPGSATMAAQFRAYLAELREAKAGDMGEAPIVGGKAVAQSLRRGLRKQYRDTYGAQVRARVTAALTGASPFAERLAHFWANHFAVSADKLETIGLAGTLEFEAIRPHLFGRFGDLLLAVDTHPAMLLYLDQAQSIGPGSQVGARAASRLNPRRKVGLNENLAREILELHTLGVGGGYAQVDVQELARAMTGWSAGGFVRRQAGVEATDGAFVFQSNWHEPGVRTLLGKTYRQEGAAQAQAMLADLAVHPATARHLATKLARHFAADVPPPALVERLTAVHLRSGGDLSALYAVLIDAPEIWATPVPKFRSPWEWTVAALRGIGAPEAPHLRLVNALQELGQPVWRPGSPAGWEDTAASWAAPDALLRRVEVAQRFATAVGDTRDARTLATQLFGPALTPATETTIARADSNVQGLVLLLVSPEFMRR